MQGHAPGKSLKTATRVNSQYFQRTLKRPAPQLLRLNHYWTSTPQPRFERRRVTGGALAVNGFRVRAGARAVSMLRFAQHHSERFGSVSGITAGGRRHKDADYFVLHDGVTTCGLQPSTRRRPLQP